MPRPDAADLFVLSVAVGGAVLDARLIREDRRLITAALRRPVALAFLTALTLHAWDLLGPFDPFRAAARLIPRRVCVPVVSQPDGTALRLPDLRPGRVQSLPLVRDP